MPEKYKKIIRFVLIGIIILVFVVPLCVNSFTSYYRYATRYSRRENHVLEPITDDLREEHLIDTKTSIPKVVYLTYHDLNSIPDYVLNNLERYCKGLKIKLFNDEDCREFLSRTIGQQAVDIFNKLEKGAHKADFWRYNILYQRGGCYFDIKTKFYAPITKIVNFNSSNTWYGVIGSKQESNKKQIYNGIIVTSPNNPIIGKAIKHIYDNPKPKDYHLFVNQLYDLVQEDCDKPLKVGLNTQKNGWKCILFQENCIKCGGLTGIPKKKCDRYNLHCEIENDKGKTIFGTRYKDFPWENKRKDFKIFVINLERKPERKKYIEQELKFKSATDPTVRVMKAFDGSKFTDKEIEEYSKGSIMGLTKGQVGCFYSHLLLWEKIAYGPHSWGFILEDDANLTTDWDKQLLSYLEEVPDFDVFFAHNVRFPWIILDGNDDFSKRRREFGKYTQKHYGRNIFTDYPKDVKVSKNCVRIGPRLDLTGYALSRKGARFLYENIGPMLAPLDVQLWFPNLYDNLNFYSCETPLIVSDAKFGSDTWYNM